MQLSIRTKHGPNMTAVESITLCKSAEYFKRIYKYAYLTGWPNFWHTELDLPAIIKKCHSAESIAFSLASLLLVVNELASFFTQTELSEKQKTDRVLFGFAHAFLMSYGYFLTYFQKTVRNYTLSLTVELKELYNDVEVEAAMIKKARWHSLAFCLMCSSSLVSYGFDGIMACLFDKDGTFVTVITAWPDVKDHSTPAVYFRVFAYVLWWIFMSRVTTIFVMVISTLVCLGYQYKNLQSYFYSLNKIFEGDLPQEEKEEKYIKGLKLGINMHARTLWCTRQCEKCIMGIVSGQIVVNVAVIILLMAQMVSSERTLASVAATLCTLSAMLISMGYFMWNAGDVSVEAEAVSTAMFSSGWENCFGTASVQVRKLLVVAMTQAQVPVSICCLGIIPMSYASYVSVVKSSYSVFSMLY